MAITTSTGKSAEPVKPNSCAHKLEFPVAPDFVPSNAIGSAELALEASRRYLPKVMSSPGFWARRREEGCAVEFDLFHPEKVDATYPADLLDSIFPQA
jgi:hypothetical protein